MTEKSSNNLKTDFIDNISHELRTPLAVAREFSSIILNELAGKVNKFQGVL